MKMKGLFKQKITKNEKMKFLDFRRNEEKSDIYIYIYIYINTDTKI